VGLAHFTLGALIPAAGGFILFRYRLIGAGDVKLLAAIGGLTGDGTILQFLLVSFVCGGVLSLAIMLSCTDFRERVKVLSHFLMKQSAVGKPVSYRSVSRELSGTTAEFHFSVPVLMAAVLYAGGIF
jgi:prepilin peptidase CpaA